MTRAYPPPGRIVRCPVCAHEFPWPVDQNVMLFDESTGKHEKTDISHYSQVMRDAARRDGYVRCPNPESSPRDQPNAPGKQAHYLPATYLDFQDPLVIGLVGAPMSGKTHLLTAMIREAYKGGLAPYGVQASALDFRRHERFTREFLRPFEDGEQLLGTGNGLFEARDILLVRGPGGTRPVTFFDVAGEDLISTRALNRSTRFLLSVNAVIFVHAMEDDPEVSGGLGAVNSGWSFELATERLQGRAEGAERIPAVIAVTKSDRLRYVPPAERWLRRPPETVLNADRIREESRDVYAYLHADGQAGSLRPYEAFRRCTLHFVSASGGDSSPVHPSTPEKDDARFARGIRPARVLAPLIAILAMTGVIGGPEAPKVGLP